MSFINIAFSGIQAAQAGMSVTSMNIANMLTPGYSRQGIVQLSVGPLGDTGLTAGNGVQVASIRRISSQYLIHQVWQTSSRASYYEMGGQYLSSLEKVISTDSTSLGTGLDEFFASLSALTTQPENLANRQALLNQANTLATRFNNMNDFIEGQKNSVNTQREAVVEQMNTLSAGIADYNTKIAQMEATGANSSALKDQRDELVRQLSSLADVKVTEDGNGAYTVSMQGGQPLVSGGVAGKVSIDIDATGQPVLNLNFANSKFTLSPSAGGELGALYDYETGTLKQMQESIKGLAEAMSTLFNEQLAKGFDLNGQQGKPLFIFDPTSTTGMLKVADLKPEEIALSDSPDDHGNGNNLQQLLELKNTQTDINGLGTMSLNDGAAAIISAVGIASKKNTTEMEAAQAVRDQAQLQRDNLSAVNQDEEAVNLQVYMQAYQANVKVISTGSQIFSDLLALF